MKTETASYIEKDEGITRLPIELYHIYDINGNHWRYTSSDASIVYDSETYTPATIKRGMVEYDEGIAATKVEIQIDYVDQSVIQYLASNPVDLMWVQIFKIFRDQSPYSASILFLGNIKNVSFQGITANIICTGLEFFLKRTIPRFRYQPSCNHTLYSQYSLGNPACTLDKTNFQLDTTVSTIDSTGLILTSADFALQANDYYSLGYLIFGNFSRMIIYHVENTIKLRYPISSLAATDSITVYPGCNKKIETCKNKFDNIINFFGHPNVPTDNPVFWT